MPRCDQREIDEGAEGNDGRYMLFSDALAQHESVLGAYRDDERGAESKAGGESGSEHEAWTLLATMPINETGSSVLASSESLHLNFLGSVKER
jgi:hypothetical protein